MPARATTDGMARSANLGQSGATGGRVSGGRVPRRTLAALIAFSAMAVCSRWKSSMRSRVSRKVLAFAAVVATV